MQGTQLKFCYSLSGAVSTGVPDLRVLRVEAFAGNWSVATREYSGDCLSLGSGEVTIFPQALEHCQLSGPRGQ